MATAAIFSFLVVSIFCSVGVTGAGFDFTCVSRYPRIISTQDYLFIGGYKGNTEINAIVNFTRNLDTGTGDGLPAGSLQRDDSEHGSRARILDMPVKGDIQRIGAFDCEAAMDTDMYSITTIITHTDGDPVAKQRTVTANEGDSVILEVTATRTDDVLWRKDGVYVGDWDNQEQVVINPVTVGDGGIYECYFQGERALAKHAIMRLIVRECPVRLWNPPSCDQSCPYCYNGGICDDKTGECICPPGFGGTACETVWGRNTFGQDGYYRCLIDKGTNFLPGCQERLFCALDPVGCLCAAGFMGPDCKDQCDDGSFGADCTEACHCANGGSDCDKATGVCGNSPGCSIGWSGSNCQDASIINIAVLATSSSSLQVSWEGTAMADTYTVEYTLTTRDQCEEVPENRTLVSTGPDTSVAITGLEAYSTYHVFVSSSETWPPCTIYIDSESGVTDEGAPSEAPGNVRRTFQGTTSLTFEWDDLACGSRGGDHSFKYSINTTPPTSGTTTSTEHIITNLEACTTYEFKVQASTSAGDGPEASIITSTKDTVPEEPEVTTSQIPNEPDKLDVTWEEDQCIHLYSVYYQLINRDQCENQAMPREPFLLDTLNTTVTIDGLEAYSTYNVIVRAANTLGYVEVVEANTTYITAPSAPPVNIRNASRTNTSLTFEWDRVPCGNRGGPNIFQYELRDINDAPIDSGNTADMEIMFGGLEPCTEYRFRVKASNDAGDGEYSNYVSWETDAGALGPVQNLETLDITSDAWTLEWDEQTESKCTTDEYFIEYALLNKDQCETLTDPDRSSFVVDTTTVTIPGLLPHSTYQVFVYPMNDYGLGEESTNLDNTTDAAPSGPPDGLRVAHIGNDFISYEWDQPQCGSRNGVIQQYKYFLTPGPEGSTEETTVTIPNLAPCTPYIFSVLATNNEGDGPTTKIEATTDADVPYEPEDLSLTDQQLEQISMTWNPPSNTDCEIMEYTVTIRTVDKPYDDSFMPSPDPDEEDSVSGETNEYTFSNLDYILPSSGYEIKVSAATTAGNGNFTEAIFYTAPANNEKYLGEPLEPTKSESTDTTVTITIPQNEDPPIHVTDYQIRVEDPKAGVILYQPGIGSIVYIAGKIDVDEVKQGPVSFIVGDNEDDGNPPLVKGREYRISIGTCSSVIDMESGCVWSKSPLIIGVDDNIIIKIVIPIVVVALVLLLLILGYVYYRHSQRNKTVSRDISEFPLTIERINEPISQRNPAMNSTPEIPVKQKQTRRPAPSPVKVVSTPKEERTEKPGPVKVENLKEYMKKKKSGEDYSFKSDYKMLPQGILSGYEASKKPTNKNKNRYANIVTYDHSRVLLSVQGDNLDSDYINASYIDGYKHPKKYIASQGPNQATFTDFWRMMWELEACKIVMVTNLVESGKTKCEKYWPDKTETYGNLTVTFEEKKELPNWIIRQFILNDVAAEDSKPRQIYQFHYTTWPDHSVPDDVTVFLKFVEVVNNYEVDNEYPTVVHCSAGVGRTGTFIAIESLMQQAEEEQEIDVFGFVSEMRKNRTHMIQTYEQYEFIYDALFEHLVFGDTSITVSAFRENYERLQIKDPDTNRSGLFVQYQHLEDITILPKPKDYEAGGGAEENVNKNRFRNLLPADKVRPYLMTEADAQSTNYINASYIHGYRTRDAFLTTQMPLPNTIVDFWRMVYDYKCNTIVMLNQMDFNDETIAQYWPSKGNKLTYGPLIVECLSEEDDVDKDIVTRRLKLRKKYTKITDQREVVQFALRNWSNDGKILPDKKCVGNLANKVIDRMQKHKDDRVAVHCINGMSVSGTFVAIVSALDRLASERTVDIFQTLKRVRMCNGRSVSTEKHFKFVYEVVLENLEESVQAHAV